MRDFFRELKDFYRFFKLPKDKKQIVFYSEQSSYYAYFEGLINELTGRHKQSVCFITSDIKDPILKTTNRLVTPLYLNKLLAFFMPLADCLVMVMTLTDLGNYHLKRSKSPVHYVYVFHALVSTHMVYSENAFNNYDSILCAGPHHVAEFRRHEEIHRLAPKKLIEAGYYRLERIHDNYKRSSKNSGKKTVLVAPSWGEGNIVESCGKELIKALLASGYDVILRPHPETIKRSGSKVREIEKAFTKDPGFKLERSVLSDDSLLRADVLITDYSGVALEYALGTERPVVFIETPPKVRNVKFNELGLEPLELLLRSRLGKIVSPDDLSSIPDLISNLASEADMYREKIIAIREQTVYNWGRSSEEGAKYIMNLL